MQDIVSRCRNLKYLPSPSTREKRWLSRCLTVNPPVWPPSDSVAGCSTIPPRQASHLTLTIPWFLTTPWILSSPFQPNLPAAPHPPFTAAVSIEVIPCQEVCFSAGWGIRLGNTSSANEAGGEWNHFNSRVLRVHGHLEHYFLFSIHPCEALMTDDHKCQRWLCLHPHVGCFKR